MIPCEKIQIDEILSISTKFEEDCILKGFEIDNSIIEKEFLLKKELNDDLIILKDFEIDKAELII